MNGVSGPDSEDYSPWADRKGAQAKSSSPQQPQTKMSDSYSNTLPVRKSVAPKNSYAASKGSRPAPQLGGQGSHTCVHACAAPGTRGDSLLRGFSGLPVPSGEWWAVPGAGVLRRPRGQWDSSRPGRGAGRGDPPPDRPVGPAPRRVAALSPIPAPRPFQIPSPPGSGGPSTAGPLGPSRWEGSEPPALLRLNVPHAPCRRS